ncbi:MAG: glutamine-hydrolyzing GMP synthase [bacterium]
MSLRENIDRIVIIDFGSQYSQLISRRIREIGVFSEIARPDITREEIEPTSHLKGIVLSGGPYSVYEKNAPKPHDFIFELGIPVLGICYGHQYIGNKFGGSVKPAQKHEYGYAHLKVIEKHLLFNRWGDGGQVWMSHGDSIEKIPDGFRAIARTDNSPYAVISNEQDAIIGVQFHPEVRHTERGEEILKGFVIDICKARTEWSPTNFINDAITEIREKVGDEKVLCAVSGGVDSSTLALLLRKAIGKKALCVFIDNGLLRKDEGESVRKALGELVGLEVIDESKRFITTLKSITDPEEKRKVIGETFIRVFEERAKREEGLRFLAQGTLYPDMIESTPVKGPSSTIKTHHNVGGLPIEMALELIEPFRFLFKDEVRRVGQELGLPDEILGRHPFPGPGLAVRIIGEVTSERLEILREADAIAIEVLRKTGCYEKVSQAVVVLLPVRSVGVMGDARTYQNVVALRFVITEDFMTADWARLDYEVLSEISRRITNEVKGVNRVVYDITTKPPATIEWE